MSSQQQIIERIRKLEALAVSEKQIGNLQASKTAQDKANILKEKYNLLNFNFSTSNTTSPKTKEENNSLYRFNKKVRFRSNMKEDILYSLIRLSLHHNCHFESYKVEVVEKKFFFFPYKSVIDFSITGSYKNLLSFRESFYTWISD